MSPRYEPWRGGRYDVRPNLHAFGRDFGNGDLDRRVFQLAGGAAKRRNESLRYGLDRFALDATVSFGEAALAAGLGVQGSDPAAKAASPGEGDALQRLASRVPEDLAVVRLDRATGRDWVAALEVAHPAGWNPREKIGQSFDAIHGPVAGAAALRARSSQYVRAMCAATGGLVRFGWGLQFDADLDKMPSRPQSAFDPAAPRVLARVERQTMHGLCGGSAALFTIRTYLYDVADLADDSRRDLASAVASMSPAARAYKGLPADVGELAAFIARSRGRSRP